MWGVYRLSYLAGISFPPFSLQSSDIDTSRCATSLSYLLFSSHGLFFNASEHQIQNTLQNKEKENLIEKPPSDDSSYSSLYLSYTYY